MVEFLAWYLVISIIGISSIPLAFRFFPKLPDRGYAFLRALGLLMWGFVFWLLGSLGVLQNDTGGQVTAFLIVAGVSLWLGYSEWKEIARWFKNHKKSVAVVEALFLVLFAGWTIVRAANPTISGTEKPMEMAFISSILRSDGLPPADPWLSGYSISYYYFGYVMVAMLTRAAGTGVGVGFNLASALWFALTGVGAYGVLYNLVNHWRGKKGGTSRGDASIVKPLLAPLFMLIISNFEGFLELLHARGIFWTKLADGSWTSKFWTWLKIAELNQPPSEPLSWVPNRAGGVIWWRASRVIQDFRLQDSPSAIVQATAPIEIIDEFPFFSYLLADLHPHVLVVPFVLLAIGLAMNLMFSDGKPFSSRVSLEWLKRPEFWFGAVVMGSLGFLNIWDFPIYVGLFSLVYVYRLAQGDGWKWGRLGDFILCGLIFGVAGFVLYLPYYAGFDSQAGGLMPSLLFFTRGINFWVMFGTLLIPILAWLIFMARKKGELNFQLKPGLLFSIALIGGLWIFMLVLSLLAINLTTIGTWLGPNGQNYTGWGQAFLGLQAGDSYSAVIDAPGGLIGESFIRRILSPGTWLTLGVLIVLVWGLIFRPRREDNDEAAATNNAHHFVLLMVFLGAALTLVPEFIYLRDQFATRMNTIFKFYYQTWVLWSIAAGYASVVLVSELRGWKQMAIFAVISLVVVAGLVYPITMLPERMGEAGLKVSELQIDGTEYIRQYNPDEKAAMEWLQDAPVGVIAEAVGGAYSGYARISEHTGMPTVIGWAHHESQWRGGYEEVGSRPEDIDILYSSKTWDDTKTIIDQYDIRYIYVGSLERSTYDVYETKFQKYLKPVFTSGLTVIYEVPGAASSLP